MGKNTEKLGKKKETNHSFSGTMYSVFLIPLWLFQHQTHHLEKRFFFFFFCLFVCFAFLLCFTSHSARYIKGPSINRMSK